VESNLEQQTPKLNVTNISSAVFGKDGPALGEESKIGKLSRILRTTRLKVNNLEKVVGKQEQLIKLTEEKTNDNIKKTTLNAEKITRLKNILQNQKSDIGEKLPGSTEEKEKAKLTTTLEETNRILVEIQKQLAYDFAMRVAEDKQEAEDEKEATSKKRFKREETALEKSAKKVVSTVKNATKKIVSPIGDFFNKIISFLGILGKGIGVNAAFEFFKDPENRRRITKFFNILKENWQLILGVIGVIAGALIVGKLLSLVAVLSGAGGLIPFLLNPKTLLLLGTLAAAAYGFTAKTGAENLAEAIGEGDTGEANRILAVKKLEKLLSLSDEKLLDANPEFKRQLGGASKVREELSKSLYFLKTGQQLGYGFFTSREDFIKKAADTKYVPDLDFSKFSEARFKLFGFDLRNPFSFSDGSETIQPRAIGGPVKAGSTYLVGERGPELFSPNIDGSIVNNMRTEKIYQMLASGKRGRMRIVELPPQTIEGPKPEMKLPRGPATKAPKISSSNSLDGYRSVTSEIYGIMV
jgi:hypothetical protein